MNLCERAFDKYLCRISAIYLLCKGAGYDCYRTYELLLVGVIPIVPAVHGGNHGLYQDLPVFEMNDFTKNRTRAEYLQEMRNYLQSDAFRNLDLDKGWERLFLRYWRRSILKWAKRDQFILEDPNTRYKYYQAWRYTLERPKILDVPSQYS